MIFNESPAGLRPILRLVSESDSAWQNSCLRLRLSDSSQAAESESKSAEANVIASGRTLCDSRDWESV